MICDRPRDWAVIMDHDDAGGKRVRVMRKAERKRGREGLMEKLVEV